MTIDAKAEPTHLAVRVADHWFGVPVALAADTQRPIGVAPLPGAPPWMLGITWCQDSPVALIDLARLAGVGEGEPTLLLRLAGTSIALATTAVAAATIRVDSPTGSAPIAAWALAPCTFENGLLHPVDCESLLAYVHRER